LTVVVLDAGGHDIALKRQDGSGILRVDIARGKAWGALGMGFSSRELGERAQKAPTFFGALASVSQGRLVPVAGGVLIHDEERNVVAQWESVATHRIATKIALSTASRPRPCSDNGSLRYSNRSNLMAVCPTIKSRSAAVIVSRRSTSPNGSASPMSKQ